MTGEEWPSVTAIVPTRDRLELMGEAVQAVLDQDYPGELDVIVVLDRPPHDAVLPEVTSDRRVRVVSNSHTPGLAGARNTGILATDADLVAFCDDDDVWLPGKLRRQVSTLASRPQAQFATCAVEVRYDDTVTPRLAGRDTIRRQDLLPKRMSMLHSSTFVIRRTDLIERIGLLSEDLPHSQNEDWDLLLRASAVADIAHVDEPLVAVTWWARSYFAGDWETKIASLIWMLDHHPDLAASHRGASRVFGQIGFAYAASGQRREALRWSRRAIRRSWREVRGYVALAVTMGVPAELVLRELHKRGRGI